MKYPINEEIKTADREQICRWYRFLPDATNQNEADLIHKIVVKFELFGGFTPEISKKIGWDEN